MKFLPANTFKSIIENRAKLLAYSFPIAIIAYIISLVLLGSTQETKQYEIATIVLLILFISSVIFAISILSYLLIAVLSLLKADAKKHLNYGWIYLPLFIFASLFFALTFFSLNESSFSSKKYYPNSTNPNIDLDLENELSKEDSNTVLSVFYATNRKLKPSDSNKLLASYSAQRSKSLSYGTCDVSIPRDHKMGELERPSLWRLEIREDTNKHVVIKSVNVANSKTAFYKKLSERVNDSLGNNAFIFIHGFNVTFEAAAMRTAQISYDIGFKGAPIFFSWPSRGTITGYPADEATIEISQLYLKKFLNDFLTLSKANNIYLIAHSMGNRALTKAITSVLAERPKEKNRIREIILTAPDIDADVFKEDIAPSIIATKCPLTLYISSKDQALTASKAFHRFPRAGDSNGEIIILKGMDTIDATDVDTGFLGHSYIAENRSVLTDIHELIINGLKPEKRNLKLLSKGKVTYWKFKR